MGVCAGVGRIVTHIDTIVQAGTPFQIYNEPTNMFASGYVGESNIYLGKVL